MRLKRRTWEPPPPCLPGEAHHWDIDAGNLGRCRKCGREYQFPRATDPIVARNRIVVSKVQAYGLRNTPQARVLVAALEHSRIEHAVAAGGW